MRPTQVKMLVGISIVVGAVVWLAATGFDESKAYFKTVPELAAMGKEAHGKRIKVAGDVKVGTLVRTPHLTTFELELEGATRKVAYIGKAVLPDTFKEGAKVVADGRLRDDGVFEAKQIQAKCASKYESTGYPGGDMPEAMRKAIERGESAPSGHPDGAM